MLGLTFVFVTLGRPLEHALAIPGWAQPIVHTALLGGTLVAFVVLCATRDADARATLGLRPRSWLLEVGLGLLGFFAVYAAALLAVGILSVVVPKAQIADAIHDKEAAMEQLRQVPLVPALFVALFAGVYEELAFRGFLLTRVRTLLGAAEGVRGGGREVAAVILSAVFFGLGHLYQGPLGVAQTLVAGLVLGAIAAYRRSIVASMVAHVAVDVLGFVALHAATR